MAQNAAFGPKTELNQPITGERGFAGASIPLDTLKALAAAHDAKLNDVVMALCSGMLRRYLARHGGVPKKPLIAAMPISLREAGNTEYTTQATMAVVNLNTHIADPVKRLVAIRDAAGAVKAVAKRAKGLMPTDFPTIGVPWVMHGLATLYGRSGLSKAMPPLANVVISNVPGPQVPLYAAGARMAHLLADVDRRTRHGAEHHRVELCRRDGLRLHHGAQRGGRCPRAVGGVGEALDELVARSAPATQSARGPGCGLTFQPPVAALPAAGSEARRKVARRIKRVPG